MLATAFGTIKAILAAWEWVWPLGMECAGKKSFRHCVVGMEDDPAAFPCSPSPFSCSSFHYCESSRAGIHTSCWILSWNDNG